MRCFTLAILSNPDSNARRQQPPRQMREMVKSHVGVRAELCSPLVSVLRSFPQATQKEPGQHSLYQSPPSPGKASLISLSKTQSLGRASHNLHQHITPVKVINNTFSLGKSPKKRIILTTVKSISMTTPETSKNQLPHKVECLMKGQRLLETTGGFFKMVT